MAKADDFGTVFRRLRSILEPYAPRLVVKTDSEATYYLDTPIMQKNKTPLFFGAVQLNKKYVNYHLFPVYVFPDLLSGLSLELRKRMQGKACFNFTQIDEPLFEELARLTEAGMERFAKEVHGWKLC